MLAGRERWPTAMTKAQLQTTEAADRPAIRTNRVEAFRRILAGRRIPAFTPKRSRIAREVKEVHDLGVQMAIMVGGGNIFRGARQKVACDRPRHGRLHGHAGDGDQWAGAAGRAGKSRACHTRLLSAIEMHQVAEPFIRRRATRHLEKGRVVIFAAGTGNPYFSTDTAAALRAMEIKAQRDFEGHAGGWHLRRRSRKSAGRQSFAGSPTSTCCSRAYGDGFDGHFAVHGQQNADHRVRHERGRKSASAWCWAKQLVRW